MHTGHQPASCVRLSGRRNCVRSVWPESAPFRSLPRVSRPRLITSRKVLMVRPLATAVLAGLVLLTTACTTTSNGKPLAAQLPTEQSTASPTKTTPKSTTKSTTAAATGGGEKTVGKAQTIKDGSDSGVITLISVRTSAKGEDGIEPKSGNYVIFLLKIECKSGTISTNSLYAQLKTPEGKLIDGMTGNAFMNTVDPDLPLKDIGPGESVEGTVVLDTPMPPGSKLVWLNPLDKPLAEWPL
jgi:hypothetical protein